MQRHWPVLHVEAPIWAGSKEICIGKFLGMTQQCALVILYNFVHFMYTIMNYSNLRAIVVFTICVWRCEWAGALCTCTPLCISLHNCAHFLHWFVHCQCTPLCVHFAQLCSVFAQFCASAEAGGGMRRFYTHLQPASWRQFCIHWLKHLYIHWWRCHRGQTTRMDGAPKADILGRRQFDKTLEGRAVGDHWSVWPLVISLEGLRLAVRDNQWIKGFNIIHSRRQFTRTLE